MAMPVSIPRCTVADLERFPDDGNRYELLDGIVLVTPSPALPHQIVATRIAGEFLHALKAGPEALVAAPGVVRLPPKTELRPDVLVSRKPGPGSTWDDVKEHWLAVEVLSPSSRLYDRNYKRDAYLQLGVAEVWLVDLEARQVFVSSTRPKRTDEPHAEIVAWHAPASGTTVQLSLADLFAGI